MSQWLDRANWFAAYACDTLAAAKAWPQWRPSGIAKRCLKELLFEDAHHVECHWFGHHKQASTDKIVSAGLTPHPIF